MSILLGILFVIIFMPLIIKVFREETPSERAEKLRLKRELLAKIKALPVIEDSASPGARARKAEIDMLERYIAESTCEHLIGLGGTCVKCGYVGSGGATY